MIIQIDPSNSVPIYRQIMEQIIYRIAAGELLPGDQLPSIRRLSTSLRINPNTVIKSYRELELRGFAESKHGRGFFVAESGVHDAEADWSRRARENLIQSVKKALAVGYSSEKVLTIVRGVITKEDSHE